MSDDIASNSAGQLKAFIERIERLDSDIKDLNADKRDIYAEAKSNGFNAKAIKHIVSLRSKDANEVQEFDAIVELYKSAVGM